MKSLGQGHHPRHHPTIILASSYFFLQQDSGLRRGALLVEAGGLVWAGGRKYFFLFSGPGNPKKKYVPYWVFSMQGTRMIALPAIILVIRMIILMLWYMPE